MGKEKLEIKNEALDKKLKEIVTYKIMQISNMLSYVKIYKTSRDYMYFGWKLQDGNVKIYDLVQNETFQENAKKMGIKYVVTKKDITFCELAPT